MKKKVIAAALIIGVTLSASIPAYAAQWKQDGTGWWYERDNGTYPAGGWEMISGNWYYFNGSGYMQTGWIESNGEWYYCVPSGEMLHDTTQTIDGVSYTFQSSGAWLQQGTGQAVSITKAQAEQWFYATYAVIANETEWNQSYFVSPQGHWKEEAKYRLNLAWGITDRASADETINWLLTSGHRSSFQTEMETLSYLGYLDGSEAQIEAQYKDNEIVKDMLLLYKRSGAGAIDGWDYCRAMQVLRECYLAEYYTEMEMLDQMLSVARTIQGRFSSWDDMAESYLRGYEYWRSSPDDYRTRKGLYEKLKRETSYFTVDWNLPLGKAW